MGAMAISQAFLSFRVSVSSVVGGFRALCLAAAICFCASVSFASGTRWMEESAYLAPKGGGCESWRVWYASVFGLCYRWTVEIKNPLWRWWRRSSQLISHVVRLEYIFFDVDWLLDFNVSG